MRSSYLTSESSSLDTLYARSPRCAASPSWPSQWWWACPWPSPLLNVKGSLSFSLLLTQLSFWFFTSPTSDLNLEFMSDIIFSSSSILTMVRSGDFFEAKMSSRWLRSTFSVWTICCTTGCCSTGSVPPVAMGLACSYLIASHIFGISSLLIWLMCLELDSFAITMLIWSCSLLAASSFYLWSRTSLFSSKSLHLSRIDWRSSTDTPCVWSQSHFWLKCLHSFGRIGVFLICAIRSSVSPQDAFISPKWSRMNSKTDLRP